MMKKLLFALFLCCSITFYGQNPSLVSLSQNDFLEEKSSVETSSKPADKKETFFDFVSKKEIFEFTLTADFDTLIENKRKIVDFLPGKVSFLNDENELDTLKVTLRPRGKFRRKVCDFPPLRLKFKKKGLRKMGLKDNYNSFKIVTHCLESKKDSKKNILREYLIYKIYNLHTDHSFRAQLIKITYVQKGSNKKLFKRYGILLEGDKELAKRSNADVVEKFAVTPDSLTTFSGSLHSVFQCMIGNSDWSMSGMRNVKLLRLENEKQLTILPYDFDCSGFVEASYAIPNPDYKLTSTRQRVFLGKIYSEEEMIQITNHFLDKKDATLTTIKNFSLLHRKCRKQTIKYLKSFYEMMEDEKKFIEELHKLSPKKP